MELSFGDREELLGTGRIMGKGEACQGTEGLGSYEGPALGNVAS